MFTSNKENGLSFRLSFFFFKGGIGARQMQLLQPNMHHPTKQFFTWYPSWTFRDNKNHQSM